MKKLITVTLLAAAMAIQDTRDILTRIYGE